MYCWVFGQWFNIPLALTCILTSVPNSTFGHEGRRNCPAPWSTQSSEYDLCFVHCECRPRPEEWWILMFLVRISPLLRKYLIITFTKNSSIPHSWRPNIRNDSDNFIENTLVSYNKHGRFQSGFVLFAPADAYYLMKWTDSYRGE